MRKDIPSPQPSPRKRGEGVNTPLPPAGEGQGERALLANAKQLRSNQTDAEHKLWHHLRANRFMGLKFKRQKPVGRYIADFVCIEHKLIIELDGGQHAEQTAYDTERDEWLRGEGFTVLRFWNNEAMQELEGVLETIRLALSPCPSPQPSPRARGEGVDLLPSPARGAKAGLRGAGAGGEGKR
ncbi:MAG: endonuclease domain-containing protein [Rhodocyclaceae bacterium]|jgi:very-short-patch-repair endonuclease|nr:endonuclease domain-containing protein [Rhodocyclaceae bacterium]MCL4682967.1 endonuclease domain-containing protein [Rhodocyclaceae bacterium]